MRPLQSDDAITMFRYRSSPEVSRYQLWHPRDLNEVMAFIKSMSGAEPDVPGTWLQLGICLLSSGDLIGDCGLHFLEDRMGDVEVGITVMTEHQKHGYAAEALGAVLGYLFGDLHKERVWASIDRRNRRAIRLVKRLGLRADTEASMRIRRENQLIGDVVYTIRRDEMLRGLR